MVPRDKREDDTWEYRASTFALIGTGEGGDKFGSNIRLAEACTANTIPVPGLHEIRRDGPFQFHAIVIRTTSIARL
jgi:hypothetical protein